MGDPARCGGRTDKSLLAEIALLLEQRYRSGDATGLARRRERLRTAFGCLSVSAAKPLRDRLQQPDAKDPLTVWFSRLAGATREQLLRELDRVLGATVQPSPEPAITTLPPLVGQRVLQREIDAQLTEMRKLPREQRLARADATLRILRSISAEPRFAEVDRRLLGEIESQARQIENRLADFAYAREHNVREVEERGVSWGAVGMVAVADGPEPGPADALALLGAGVAALFITRTVVEVIDPDIIERQAEELAELVREAQDRLRDLPPAPVRRINRRADPRPAPSEPRTVDVAPPVEQEDRRRRQACQRQWVPRRGGTPFTNYHNEFAAAMVAALRIPASPDMDYRVTKGGLQSTDYDSYDSESSTFWEFKTRHDYLPYEGLPITWLRLSSIFAQAMDQRMTLIRCGFEGEIVWVFEDPRVATAAREYIAPWPVDRVIAHPWQRRKPIRSGGGETPPKP